jgi:hypothetical protein
LTQILGEPCEFQVASGGRRQETVGDIARRLARAKVGDAYGLPSEPRARAEDATAATGATIKQSAHTASERLQQLQLRVDKALSISTDREALPTRDYSPRAAHTPMRDYSQRVGQSKAPLPDRTPPSNWRKSPPSSSVKSPQPLHPSLSSFDNSVSYSKKFSPQLPTRQGPQGFDNDSTFAQAIGSAV